MTVLGMVDEVFILQGKSMWVAHLLEVDFGEGGSCCFFIGSKGVQSNGVKQCLQGEQIKLCFINCLLLRLGFNL